MTIKTHPVIAEYVDAVTADLSDLPASEVEQIVEDLRVHLAEVANELDGVSLAALTARLGTPEQYAADLRAAAGFPATAGHPPLIPAGTTLSLRWGLVVGALVAFLTGLTGPTAPIRFRCS